MSAFMSAVAAFIFFVLAVTCMVVSIREYGRPAAFTLTALVMAVVFFVVAIGLAKFGGW